MTEKPSKALILAARRELKRRAATQALAPFITYTYPTYLMGWVHADICQALDQFLDDILAKRSPRLIITLPPRSGKSEIVSRRFPAYALGRNPDLQIIATSYGADLSARFNRDVQRIIDDDPYRAIFPDTTLAGKNVKTSASGSYIRTSDLFEVVGYKGAYRSTGVGGGITGQGADILIVDDPVKDRASANSATIRDATWDWYTSTAYTRLSPGGGVIVMCTRWHCDDLVGRLLARAESGSGDKWKVINYPAIAEHDEPHRKAGEALHPERYPIEALERIRAAVGMRDWEALYQQHPVPDGGGLFKADWIQHWKELPKQFDAMVLSWDMTFKDTAASDYVVGQVWGRKGGNFYLCDQFRGQWDFVKTLQQFVAASKKWPRVTRKLVEDKANGSAIISTLKRHVSGIIPITPKESKEARASAVATLWEAHNVFLPPKDLYPWVEQDFIPELLSFPAGAHDDQCFVAGTLIATLWGDRPIETIKPGDLVLTPFGFKRVLAAGKTGEAETITKLGITATRKHPFFTKHGDFKKFCLVVEEECSALTLCQMNEANRLLQSSSMASNTASYLKGAITSVSQRRMKGEKGPRAFTSPSGSGTQGRRFRGDGKSITRTAIRLITITTTLSAYRVANTVRQPISKLRKFARTLIESVRLHLLGTEAKPAENGTEITRNSRRSADKNASAFAAESSSCQRRATQSSAVAIVKSSIDTTMNPFRKNEPASSAAKSSRPWLAPTGTVHRRVADGAEACSESRGRMKQPVFNLKVEGAHCFYANGLLVHNCDAMTQALSDLNKSGGLKMDPTNLAYLFGT